MPHAMPKDDYCFCLEAALLLADLLGRQRSSPGSSEKKPNPAAAHPDGAGATA